MRARTQHAIGAALWHRRRVDLVSLTERLVSRGFDIVQAFPAHDVARHPDFGRLHDPERPVGVLVGNTRGLWNVIARLRAMDERVRDEAHPFDAYTEAQMAALTGASAVFAHQPQHDGRYFPFQRLAVAVGLAALAPSQLLIHPIYGPWFSLRAIVLVPGEPPPLAPPVALPCTCARHGCVATFDHAMAHPEDWRAWLAVRDACPIGREYRYGDDQLAYHYTKDHQYLR